MITATLSAASSIFMFIWRYRRQLAALTAIAAISAAMFVDGRRQAECPTGGDSIVPAGSFAYPTDKNATQVSSGYGPRDGAMHQGIDLAGPIGTPIFAFTDGTVAAAGSAQGFGNWIVLDHTIDGKPYSTVYGHMYDDGVLVKTGDRVQAGQRIGLIGNNGQSTGPHLHFEVWDGGRLGGGHSVDPASWLDRAGSQSRPGRDSPDASRAPPSSGNVQELRAKQIIDVGHRRNMPRHVIESALSVAIIESNLRNLASEAVPESKNYPNDGVADGDYDSVGVFQQRRSTQGAGVDIKTAMDPVWQANKYYSVVQEQPGWRSADPGELAANVQRPREDLRYKYGSVMDQAKELYRKLGGQAAGTAGDLGGGCGVPGSGDPGPAGDLAKRAVAVALAQLGKPYIWAAEGPDAFDCSGLIRYAYLKASGGKVSLPHYTGDPSNPGLLAVGVEVPDQKSLQPGDIILTNGDRTRAAHVVMYIGNGKVANAPQSNDVVRITTIAEAGNVVMIRRIPDNPARR